MNTAFHSPERASAADLPPRTDLGFSLIETLVALLIILIVMAGVMGSMVQFSRTQATVWNRSNMHGSVRSATELLQQEVGQAGRISLPATVTTTGAIATGTQTVAVTSTSGMFAGEQLVVDAGANEETVSVSNVNSATSFTANFMLSHPSGAPVYVIGGFATGIVPTTVTNGSTGTVLKVYGDINDDGQMVYVEYVCDTTGGNLYRNMMAFDSASKQALNSSQILLSNVLPNPGGTPCFTYEQKTVNGITYVVNVAISLTTQTQLRDATTGQFQTETKALLNVAPRNVFDVWQLASIGANNRVQPMPASVVNLLH